MIGTALGALDGGLSFLPALLRVVLYGGVAGAGAMFLYGWLLPQERLAALQAELAKARSRMHDYDGDEPREILRLARASLGLSLKQLVVVFLPTVLAALPVLLMLGWLEGVYGHRLPEPGTPVPVSLVSGSATTPAPGSPVAWPAPGTQESVEGPSGATLLTLPLEHPRTRVTRERGWHRLFASPVGYLPADAEVEAVVLRLPDRTFLPWGPRWLRGWHALFLLMLSLAAVGVKYGYGIR